MENLGQHYSELTKLMAGITTVELVEQSSDSVVIKTNEGTMTRKNIAKQISENSVNVELDEIYEGKALITVTSHISEHYTTTNSGTNLYLTVSDIKAPGLFGFFYRNFGKRSMKRAFLNSYKTYFD